MSFEIERKLSKRLRELRKLHACTQQEVAERAGLDYKHIQLLESKHPPSARIETLDKIAKAFRMTVAELLDFSKKR